MAKHCLVRKLSCSVLPYVSIERPPLSPFFYFIRCYPCSFRFESGIFFNFHRQATITKAAAPAQAMGSAKKMTPLPQIRVNTSAAVTLMTNSMMPETMGPTPFPSPCNTLRYMCSRYRVNSRLLDRKSVV